MLKTQGDEWKKEDFEIGNYAKRRIKTPKSCLNKESILSRSRQILIGKQASLL
jgi:hypothetical protein